MQTGSRLVRQADCDAWAVIGCAVGLGASRQLLRIKNYEMGRNPFPKRGFVRCPG
jgi:hypothetical protein